MPERPHDLYESEHADRANSRLGLVFFFIYLVVYAGFVALCAFDLGTMAKPILGVNLAIFYGVALIAFAFLLGVVYMFFCKRSNGQKDEA